MHTHTRVDTERSLRTPLITTRRRKTRWAQWYPSSRKARTVKHTRKADERTWGSLHVELLCWWYTLVPCSSLPWHYGFSSEEDNFHFIRLVFGKVHLGFKLNYGYGEMYIIFSVSWSSPGGCWGWGERTRAENALARWGVTSGETHRTA